MYDIEGKNGYSGIRNISTINGLLVTADLPLPPDLVMLLWTSIALQEREGVEGGVREASAGRRWKMKLEERPITCNRCKS